MTDILKKLSEETTADVGKKHPVNMLTNIIRYSSELMTDILFPRRCPVCGEIVLPKGSLICPGCMAKLSWVRRPVCKKCGKEVADGTIEYCYDCTRHKRTFDYGLSLINYDDTASRSMARIKYNNRREYLDFYSEAMVRKMGKRIQSMNGDVLVPVPVHPSRRRERGFNQAEELAVRLSGPLGIPVNTAILKRERKTAPQKSLDSSGRLKNLEQAFSASALPPGIKNIILVDDIYTTGSTVEACTRVLRKAGAENVYFVTIFIGHG